MPQIGLGGDHDLAGFARVGFGIGRPAVIHLLGTEEDHPQRPARMMRQPGDQPAGLETMARPAPSSVAPVPRSQESRCPPMRTISSGRSLPFTSATTFQDEALPAEPSVSAQAGSDRCLSAANRSSCSASGMASAAAGVPAVRRLRN